MKPCHLSAVATQREPVGWFYMFVWVAYADSFSLGLLFLFFFKLTELIRS